MATERRAPRTALLVDWGGVLTTNLFASFGAFCTDAGLAPETLAQRFRGDDEFRALLIAFEEGKIEEAAFEERFGGMLGVAARRPDRPPVRARRPGPGDARRGRAPRARAGIRTGLVSNSWGTRRYDRTMLEELFDGVVISGEVGMRKPAPEMYRLGAERTGVAPEACVYVDDLSSTCRRPRSSGWRPSTTRDAATTIAELERLLGLALA